MGGPKPLFPQSRYNVKLTSETLRVSGKEGPEDQQLNSPSFQRRKVRPEKEETCPRSPGKEMEDPGLNTSSSGSVCSPLKNRRGNTKARSQTERERCNKGSNSVLRIQRSRQGHLVGRQNIRAQECRGEWDQVQGTPRNLEADCDSEGP